MIIKLKTFIQNDITYIILDARFSESYAEVILRVRNTTTGVDEEKSFPTKEWEALDIESLPFDVVIESELIWLSN